MSSAFPLRFFCISFHFFISSEMAYFCFIKFNKAVFEITSFDEASRLLHLVMSYYLFSISFFSLILKSLRLDMFTHFWQNSKWSFDEKSFWKLWEAVVTPLTITVFFKKYFSAFAYLSFPLFFWHLFSREGDKECFWIRNKNVRYCSEKKRVNICLHKYVMKWEAPHGLVFFHVIIDRSIWNLDF